MSRGKHSEAEIIAALKPNAIAADVSGSYPACFRNGRIPSNCVDALSFPNVKKTELRLRSASRDYLFAEAGPVAWSS